jgi:hypothetical protein
LLLRDRSSRLDLDSIRRDVDLLIPVGIETHPPLLLANAAVVFFFSKTSVS